MTLLMNKWENIVVDDGWVSSIGQNPILLRQQLVMNILSRMIEFWMEKSLGEWW